MKNYILTALMSVSLTFGTMADVTWQTEGNQISFKSEQGCMRIQLCDAGMFRVTKSASAEFLPDEEWMVVRYDFDAVDYQMQSLPQGGASLMTSQLTVCIEENPWLLKVIDRASGEVLYEEQDSRLSTETEGPRVRCRLQPDEHFFGFGERMEHLDQRGQRVHLNVELGRGPRPAVGGKDILRANYCPVPWFMSSKGYGIFFHTAFPTDWDMGWTDIQSYSFEADGGELDYYFIAGPSISSMLHDYQTLTGNCPMMPRSAYGLHVGSYSGGTWKYEEFTSGYYPTQLVRRLRQAGIPFDLLWLDSTWRYFNTDNFGNGGCCFEWRKPNFVDPQAMIDTIYAEHVDMFGLHIRSILDDGIESHVYTDAQQAGGVLVKGASQGGLVNFFSPEAADWWWNNGAMKVAQLGVKFVKTDCGGVYRLEGSAMSDVLPGKTNAEVHNLYTLPYAKVPYEKFAAYNNQRGFNHTREGYAGIQRYPFIWAGDWGTEWQWFEPVIRGGLNIGLSGVGYWSHCMGGFEQYSPYDTDLYLRWCQFGMFSPVSILFGMDHPRYHEPWTYGEEAQRIFTTYDSLRYTLIPYIYSNAHEMYETSRPLMTPLLFDWQYDEVTYQISDQYLFGHSMMICPVTNKGALSRPVYFPGGKWVDFWTGERIDGRQWKSFLTPQWLMPIFVREDAIIVKQPEVQWMAQSDGQPITICCYPVSQSSYELYEDDGRSMDYEQGAYATSRIESRMAESSWTLDIHKPACPAKDKKGRARFIPSRHNYCIEAYLDRKPQEVTINGNVTDNWTWDETLGLLRCETGCDNTNDITVNVR